MSTNPKDVQQPKLQISSGQHEEEIVVKVKHLISPDKELIRAWNLVLDGAGIQRSFKFKSFKKTWDFMNAVAEQCKVQNHHPEWSNCYNSTIILWTTHRPKGLTLKDVDMAAFCDEQARIHSEQMVTD